MVSPGTATGWGITGKEITVYKQCGQNSSVGSFSFIFFTIQKGNAALFGPRSYLRRVEGSEIVRFSAIGSNVHPPSISSASRSSVIIVASNRRFKF